MKKKEEEIIINPFTNFHLDWALVTAGDINHHNSMTISWGEMGTLWNKQVVTVYIKPCRYTYKFMEDNNFFVVSFFEEIYRPALNVMGSRSGRDINKDKESGLTPIEHGWVTIYKEARLTLICKKIYRQNLNIKNIPEEAIDHYYQKEKPHRMYIGEVVEIIKNE